MNEEEKQLFQVLIDSVKDLKKAQKKKLLKT